MVTPFAPVAASEPSGKALVHVVRAPEAAVISGRLAAHALSQSPPLEEIVGFDHP